MTRKTKSTWAIVMLVVFGGTILLFPTLYNPDRKDNPPVKANPEDLVPKNP